MKKARKGFSFNIQSSWDWNHVFGIETGSNIVKVIKPFLDSQPCLSLPLVNLDRRLSLVLAVADIGMFQENIVCISRNTFPFAQQGKLLADKISHYLTDDLMLKYGSSAEERFKHHLMRLLRKHFWDDYSIKWAKAIGWEDLDEQLFTGIKDSLWGIIYYSIAVLIQGGVVAETRLSLLRNFPLKGNYPIGTDQRGTFYVLVA